MKSKTAVDFLVETLAENGILHSSDIEQAKEMFMKQIIYAYHNGYSDAIQAEPKQYDPQQYCNETFKQI